MLKTSSGCRRFCTNMYGWISLGGGGALTFNKIESKSIFARQSLEMPKSQIRPPTDIISWMKAISFGTHVPKYNFETHVVSLANMSRVRPHSVLIFRTGAIIGKLLSVRVGLIYRTMPHAAFDNIGMRDLAG